MFFPEIRTEEREIYHDETMMTRYEKLKSLPQAEAHLNPVITFKILDATSYRLSDNHAADKFFVIQLLF